MKTKSKRWGRYAAGLCVLGGCLAGCQITLTDNGSFGMRAGYDISFYHTTARTDSTTVAKIESQPLSDWLKKGAPQQTDAAAAPVAPAAPDGG